VGPATRTQPRSRSVDAREQLTNDDGLVSAAVVELVSAKGGAFLPEKGASNERPPLARSGRPFPRSALMALLPALAGWLAASVRPAATNAR